MTAVRNAREARLMREEMAAFARRNGCEEIMAKAIRECPRLRRRLELDREDEMSRKADSEATRSGEPWGMAEYRRLALDEQRGEPVWRTALALGRTCQAIEGKRAWLREKARRGEMGK